MYYQISDAQATAFLNNPIVLVILAVLAIWALVWKGIALWKAARNGSKAWFVVMLVLNTVGILEIIYIFYFSKKKENIAKQ